MLLRLVAYICLIGLLFVIEYLFSFSSHLELGGLLEGVILFFTFLVFLYIEANESIKKSKKYEYARRRCLIFSFTIGVIWGILMSFAEGRHPYINFKLICVIILNYIFFGSIFSLIGLLYIKLLWKFRILIDHKG